MRVVAMQDHLLAEKDGRSRSHARLIFNSAQLGQNFFYP